MAFFQVKMTSMSFPAVVTASETLIFKLESGTLLVISKPVVALMLAVVVASRPSKGNPVPINLISMEGMREKSTPNWVTRDERSDERKESGNWVRIIATRKAHRANERSEQRAKRATSEASNERSEPHKVKCASQMSSLRSSIGRSSIFHSSFVAAVATSLTSSRSR